MNQYRTLVLGALALLPITAFGQSPVSAQSVVEKAIAASPAVKAQAARHRASEAIVRSLRAGTNPELEVSPGIGFTNSNLVFGKTFDISGQRSARVRQAEAESLESLAALNLSKARVAEAILNALAENLWANEAVGYSKQSVDSAEQTRSRVAKRVALGEAAAVQQTRAEVELQRAAQTLMEANARLTSSIAAINSLLGKEADAPLEPALWIAIPSSSQASTDAAPRRPETQVAKSRIQGALAAVAEARSKSRPELFAGVAADVWSLDRSPFRSEGLGVQVSLRMPFLDLGENRHAVRSAELLVAGREAELNETLRSIHLEIRQAEIARSAAADVAASFKAGILPKAEEMLKAMQQGYESGLVSFLEVIEAQQTLARLRRESADADLRLRLAEVRYLVATAQIPGLENPRA